MDLALLLLMALIAASAFSFGYAVGTRSTSRRWQAALRHLDAQWVDCLVEIGVWRRDWIDKWRRT